MRNKDLIELYIDFTKKLGDFTDSIDWVKIMYTLKTLRAQVEYLLQQDIVYN